jgi:hypothetical protein
LACAPIALLTSLKKPVVDIALRSFIQKYLMFFLSNTFDADSASVFRKVEKKFQRVRRIEAEKNLLPQILPTLHGRDHKSQ